MTRTHFSEVDWVCIKAGMNPAIAERDDLATAAEFRADREAAGLSQVQLAELAEVTRLTIGHYEAGRIPRQGRSFQRVRRTLTGLLNDKGASAGALVQSSARDGRRDED